MKHRVKIASVVAVLAVLLSAYFWGGNDSQHAVDNSEAMVESTLTSAASDAETATDVAESMPSSASDPASVSADEVETTSSVKTDQSSGTNADSQISGKQTAAGSTEAGGNAAADSGAAATKGKDSTPLGKSAPADTQDAVVTNQKMTCTLSVDCKSILQNVNLLKQEKSDLIPEDGIIFTETAVTFYEGENVFNVLQREMKKAGIPMEFQNTPMYDSAYIEAIDNLYEFDCGELSGWVYAVNGWFPNYGCSRYQLHDGDSIQWMYTCDLGKDVGGNNAAGS